MKPTLAFDRRTFLRTIAIFGSLGLARFSPCASAASEAFTKRALDPVRNRSPFGGNAFYPLPLGSIRPKGWLYQQLRIQANGLSGHLDETWDDVGPKSAWLGGSGESWERGPYFLDGLVPLAYVLDDSRLKAKAQRYIDWTLDNQAANGMFGPRSNDDWWPRMVMLKALTQYQEATDDTRVIPMLSRYFLYQLSQLPKRPLRDWGKYRWQDELLSVVWLYNRTGDHQLLDLAQLLHQQGHDWRIQFADFQYTQVTTREAIGLTEEHQTEASLNTHGVNNAQAIKASPVWSIVSGLQADRNAVFHQLGEIDRYHGLVNGMFSADEHLAGRNPSQGTELCTVVEAMYSLEQSLAILGDPALGDRLERIAFNALPGTFTDDMWAHQYNQEANQVECSLHRKPWTTDGPESNLYGLDPEFGCCAANFHQGWPKFAANLVMLSPDDGVVLPIYAPCEAETMIRGTSVHLIEETDYPFGGSVSTTLHSARPVHFPLRLRIPGWAQGAILKVNGEKVSEPVAGRFALMERRWRTGDRIDLEFPLKPRVSTWYNKSIALERGPLIFSYGIGEDWLKLRDRKMTADWQVYPTTQWNYAIKVDGNAVESSVSVSERPELVNGTAGPFTRSNPPVQLHVKARKIPKWVSEDGVAQPVPESPVESTEPEETLTLIPYAAAKLRITCFPKLET